MKQAQSLNAVNASIKEYTARYQRPASSIRLIAVSKTRTADEIKALYRAGQCAFGENYIQEALIKIDRLNARSIEWHFIGAIQSRKARQIAEHFQWVHSVDRLKIAGKLNQHRESASPLNVLIQVNLEAEASKGGVSPDALTDLAKQISLLENLRLRGLMFMPKVHTTLDAQRAVYAQARRLFETLKVDYPEIDQLSMGMSGDLEAAIAEGATMVRIGTALFGARQ